MESSEGDAAGSKTKCRLSITALTAITDRHLAQTIRNAIKNSLEELLQIPNLPMLQAQIMAIVHKVVQKRKRRSSTDLTPQINDFERKLKECDLRRQLMRYSTKVNPNEEFFKDTMIEDDSSDSDDDGYSSGTTSPLTPAFANKMYIHGLSASSSAGALPVSSSGGGYLHPYGMGMMHGNRGFLQSPTTSAPPTPPLSPPPEAVYKALDLTGGLHHQHTPFTSTSLQRPTLPHPLSRANSAPSLTHLISPQELLRSRHMNDLTSSYSSPVPLTPTTSSSSLNVTAAPSPTWRNEQNENLVLPPISSLFPNLIPPRDDPFKSPQPKSNNAS